MKINELTPLESSFLTGLKPFIPFLLKAKEPWLVGGTIRDSILGLPLNDFDFAIKDSAVKFARWFARQIKGAFVLLDEKRDEARVVYKSVCSGQYAVGSIIFDFTHMESIEEDLARRDFTLNALAAKLPDLKLLDPYNGRKDIENKLIRMVSEQALLEDPLRILRGFRFKATLGFKIHPTTLKVFILNKELLEKVAKERIREEFFKILCAQSSYPTLRHMAKLGVLQVIIPETQQLIGVPQGKPGGNLLDHSMLTVKKMENLVGAQDIEPLHAEFNSYLRNNLCILKLAAFLHDIGKPQCYTKDEKGEVHFYGHEKQGVRLLRSIRESLKLSNSEFKTLSTLILYHMRPHLLAGEKMLTDRAVWRLVRDASQDAPGVLLLAYADMLASGQRGKRRLLNVMQRGRAIWAKSREPRFKRILTGDDLIELGLKPGPRFKEILQAVEEAQISGELRTRQQALQFVKQNFT